MVCHCPLPGFFRTCVLKLMHPKSLSHLDPPEQEGLRSTQLGVITKGWFCLPSKPELLGGRGATEGGVTLVPIPVLGPSTSECLLIHFQEEKSTASFQRWSLQASDRPQDTGPCAGPPGEPGQHVLVPWMKGDAALESQGICIPQVCPGIFSFHPLSSPLLPTCPVCRLTHHSA